MLRSFIGGGCGGGYSECYYMHLSWVITKLFHSCGREGTIIQSCSTKRLTLFNATSSMYFLVFLNNSSFPLATYAYSISSFIGLENKSKPCLNGTSEPSPHL